MHTIGLDECPLPSPVRIQPPSTGAPGSRSSSSAASCSSTGWTSRWSASRCRASMPTCASPPRPCSGSSAATCSATAGCCCSAGARPTCSGGAPCCSSHSPCSPSRRCSARWSTSGALLIAARFIKGAERRVHRAGGPVDHHHHVRRGPGPQPRARDLHRDRRERVLARARPRRPAHRRSAGAGRSCCPFPIAARAAGRRLAAAPRRPARVRRQGRFDIARRRVGDRRDARARVRRSGAPDAGWTSAPDARRVRAGGRPRGDVPRRSSGASRDPLVRLGILRSPAIAGANLAGMAVVRVLLRLPVHGHALHAAAARLVARWRRRSRSCRPGCSWRSARRAWARWPRASAPRR